MTEIEESDEFIFLSYEELVKKQDFTEEIDGKAGYIYIIKEIDFNSTGFINYKVGQSGDPQKRIQDLQTGNLRKLKIAYPATRVNDMNQAERDIHKALSSYKSQEGGGREWYTVPPDQNKRFLATCKGALVEHKA